jgi:hypothetical protein
MQPGFVCIAGIDPETGGHVRPELRGTRIGIEMLEPNGGPFDMAVEVDLGRVKPQPSAPQVEDCVIVPGSARRLREVPPDEFWALLGSVATRSLTAVFGEELCDHGSTCFLEPGTGKASLGCLVTSEPPILEVCREAYRGQTKVRVRCHVRDEARECFPAVTDSRLYRSDQTTPRTELIANLNRRMKAGVATVLSVGVTRALSQGRHWLQVNNLHLQDDPEWRL